jgi:hypothetical protein
MTLVLSHMSGSLSNLTPKSHDVHYPKNLLAAARSRYILVFGGGLYNWKLFSRRPANERRSKKMTSIRSVLSVNPTTRKISIKKPIRSSEEEVEYQIPNSEVCLRYLKIY